MNSTRKFLVDGLKRAWRPVKRAVLEFWAEENIVIGSQESIDNPGAYKRERAVYAPRLLDLFLDGTEWRTLVVMKSSQSGLTFHVLIAVVQRIAMRVGTSIIYVIDSAKKAKDISETRLQPLLKKCKAIRAEAANATGAEESKMKLLVYQIFNAIVRLAGAGSAAQVASYPADFVIGDELDTWPDDSKKRKGKREAHSWYLLIDRIKQSEFGKAMGFSKPTTEGAITNTCYQSGSRHHYFVPCPHCSHFQTIEFEQLRFSHCKAADGKTYDLEKILRDTWLQCSSESCGKRIDEDHKLEMMLAGEWRPTNFKEIELEDGNKQMVSAWAPGEMSAHISDFYSIHIASRWGVIAVEFIKAQGSSAKLHAWTNSRRGLPIALTVVKLDYLHLLKLRGRYRRGTLPQVPCVVMLAVDNQGDHQKWVILAFLPNGTRFVVDWGITGDRQEIKTHVLRRETPVIGTDRKIGIQAGIMDEGGKDGTSYDVRKFCLPLSPMMTPSKGRGGIQVKNIVWWVDSGIEDGGNETIPVIHYDDDAFKRELYVDLIKNHDPKRQEEFNLPRLWLPIDVDEAFILELCGEQLVKEIDENGVEQNVWKPKPPNDYGDCVKIGGVWWNNVKKRYQLN